MRYPGFVDGSHLQRSPLANVERTMNWYPERSDQRLVLYPTPGTQPWLSTGNTGCRAAFSENGRTFFLMNRSFIEVTANGTQTVRGTVDTADTYPGQIVSNGLGAQLLVCSAGDAYCFTLATNAWVKVLTGEAHMIAMLDGYFLALNRNANKVRFSKNIDGTVWNANDWFQGAISADWWQAMTVNQGRIWLIGEHTGVVWWDQGGSSVPFAPIQSSVFSYGITAPWSLVVVGDSVRWLSQSIYGDGIFVSARGYRPERISDHASETALANYKAAARIDDCEALTYQQDGHVFTAFRFPSANATRVYDDTTQLWHERGYWNATTGQYEAWRPRIHVEAFGKHLVGNAVTDQISYLDQQYTTEADGSVIRRVRIAPTLHGEGERVFVDRLEVFLEPGLTPQEDPTVYFSNPKVMLRMSYDGGKTWGNERQCAAGRTGEYTRRVAFTRCGSGWSVTPQIVCSDPVQWNVIDCYLQGQGFQNQEGRAQQQGAA